MNIKEWFFPLIFAVSITFLFQYFFFGSNKDNNVQGNIQSGQSFTAPVLEQINKPLLLDIDFAKESEQEEVLREVVTEKGTYTFSSRGATLHAFNFPWQKNTQKIDTIATHADCFMVGLYNEAPLYYDFVKQEADDNVVRVVYQAGSKAGTLVKTFTLHQDSYVIDVQVELQTRGDLKDPEQIRLFVSNPVMTPGLRRDYNSGLVNTIGSGDQISIETVDVTRKKNIEKFWYTPSTFGFSSQFLVHVLLPSDGSKGATQRAYFKKEAEGRYAVVLESSEFTTASVMNWSFYIGPKTVTDLSQSAEFLVATLNYGWLSPISKGLLFLLKLFYEYLGNYGWAIILLTILLKLLFMPLMIRGDRSMRQSQDYTKKMEYLKQKYKNNPEALQRAQAEHIKKHGMPGLAGCLPMLLNLPLFLGLNKVLSNAIELHGASFLWLNNLSAPDPYYILSVIVFVGIALSPIGGQNAGARQKLFKFCFALFLSAITCYLASGLSLFIISSALMSMLQTYLQKRLG